MKRTLLLFACLFAMAASFTANAQWKMMVESVTEGLELPTNHTPSGTLELTKGLSEITVHVQYGYGSFPSNYLTGNAAIDKVELTNENGDVYHPTSVSGAGMNLLIRFNPTLKAAGTYSLTVAAGIASYTDFNGVTTESPELKAENLFKIAEQTPVTPGPDDPNPPVVEKPWYEDFEVEAQDWNDDGLYDILSISFPNLGKNKMIEQKVNDLYKYIYIKSGNETYFPSQQGTSLWSGSTKIMATFDDLNVADLLNDPTYTIVRVSADCFSVDGVMNPVLLWPEGANDPGGETPGPVTPGPDDPNPPTPVDNGWYLGFKPVLSNGTITLSFPKLGDKSLTEVNPQTPLANVIKITSGGNEVETNFWMISVDGRTISGRYNTVQLDPNDYVVTVAAGTFKVDGVENPELVWPDNGETPDDPNPPVGEKGWYNGMVVTPDGDGDAPLYRIHIEFPNMPADTQLREECAEYTLAKHVFMIAGENTYVPKYGLISASENNRVISMTFNEDEVKGLTIDDVIVKIDADVLSVDGVLNPELIWPEGAQLPDDPTPPASNVNTTLKWAFSSVLDTDDNWTYSTDKEIDAVNNIKRVVAKIEKPESWTLDQWKEYALGYSVNSDKMDGIIVSNGSETFEPSSISAGSTPIQVWINFDTPLTTEGTYEITLPEGLVSFNGEVSQAAELKDCFTIGEGSNLSFDNYTIAPADNSELTVLQTVTVTFPNAIDLMDDEQTIVLNKNFYDDLSAAARNIKLTLQQEGLGEDEDPMTISATSVAIEDFSVVASFAGQTIPEGRYEFSIPGMMFCNSKDNSVMNSGVIAFYTIVAAPEYNLTEYTFSPEPRKSVNELSTIAITFKQDVKVMNDKVNGGDFSVVALTKGEETYPCTEIEFDDENYTTVIFTFDTITADGIYTLTIPAGFFAIDLPGVPEGSSEEIKADFYVGKIDSVAAILGEATSYTVVDYAGRVVLREADKAALAGLESGFYVINGVKVVIRK